MFFLLRTAFWLTLVLVLIPLGSDQDSDSPETIDPVAAYVAAQATVSDLGGFCGRNPDTCQTGGEALAAIGSRARDGARIVYEYLDTQFAEAERPDGLITGSTATVPATGTLTADDLQVPWQQVAASATTGRPKTGAVPRPKPRSGGNT